MCSQCLPPYILLSHLLLESSFPAAQRCTAQKAMTNIEMDFQAFTWKLLKVTCSKTECLWLRLWLHGWARKHLLNYADHSRTIMNYPSQNLQPAFPHRVREVCTMMYEEAWWSIYIYIYAYMLSEQRYGESLNVAGGNFALLLRQATQASWEAFPQKPPLVTSQTYGEQHKSWALICVDCVVPATRMEWKLARLPDATMQSTRRSHAKACLSLLHCSCSLIADLMNKRCSILWIRLTTWKGRTTHTC